MTQNIEAIFLDIDGVLADFDTHAETHDVRDENGKFRYDRLDFQWWSTIPVYEGANDFYAACTKLAQTKFLTGPMLSVDCFAGKSEWLSERFLPRRGKYALTDLIICPAKNKNFLAAPGRILVDDNAKNVEQWRAAGGIGILHQGDFEATLQDIKKYTAPRPQAKPRRPQGPRP